MDIRPNSRTTDPVAQSGWHLVLGTAPADLPPGAECWLYFTDAVGGSQRIALGQLRGRTLDPVVVSLPPNVRSIHFKAASAGVAVPLPHMALRRLGRPAAFALMVWGSRDQSGRRSLLEAVRNVARFAGPALRGRLRQAGYVLASAYQARLRPRVATSTTVPCRVATTRRGKPRNACWQPVHEMRLDSVDAGQPQWVATGDDPQFRLEDAGVPLTLPAGWYRVDAVAVASAGRLLSPMLYPDYGQGCLSYEILRLPEPDAQGRLRGLVLLKAPAASLRFDPSIRRACFTLESFELRRVGRLGALLLLLDRYRCADGSRDWPCIAGALRGFMQDALRHGLSAAASRLHQGNQSGVPSADYVDWVRLYDTFDGHDLEMLRRRAHGVSGGPLISILLPVYETPARWLKQCIDSVIAQAYGNWELCIVDDASRAPHVGRMLAQYAHRDARIRVKRRDSNGHISAASNDALAMARGHFVGLLDHDDQLRPHALLEVVEMLARQPDAGLVYSDEDKIDERGRRFQPNFKPDWNPDLLLSQNYICHFTVARTDTVREAGGFRIGYEGSQDHDLFLRCIERLRPDQIRHIPKVLYHWRAITGSTALERGAKDYASAAGVRAVADHLSRVSPGARAEELAHGHYRVRWPLPAAAPLVSVIIPTRDRLELLRTCIDSVLARTTYPNFEIIVVDNQSSEPEALSYLDEIERDDRIRVLRYDAPFNYSAINNWAARQAHGDVLCLLNNDIEVMSEDWLQELVGHAIRPGVGAVGAMLYYPDRTIQHAGVVLGLGGVANHIYCGQPSGSPGHGARALVAQNLSAVTGACLVARRETYQQVGGLDERLQVAFNDIDFCLRLREAGYRNVWSPFAELIHHESASRGRDESDEKRERFLGEVRYMESRWGEWLHSDPAYNPNLSLDCLDAALALPPRTADQVVPSTAQR